MYGIAKDEGISRPSRHSESFILVTKDEDPAEQAISPIVPCGLLFIKMLAFISEAV